MTVRGHPVHRLSNVDSTMQTLAISGPLAALPAMQRPRAECCRNGDPTDRTGSGIAGSRLLGVHENGAERAEDVIGHGACVTSWQHATAVRACCTLVAENHDGRNQHGVAPSSGAWLRIGGQP